MKPTRQDYCQFLLVTQKNYTQTYFADHHAHFSHDAVNRYLLDDNITADDFWEKVKSDIKGDPNGYIIFDDTVIDKGYARKIESAQKQYSGNAHGIVYGIGVVNCLYVNSKTGECWIIDWRIFDPSKDQKTKLQHVMEMFDSVIDEKGLPFSTVLMDSWYATMEIMRHIDSRKKFFYCPLKSNRSVDDSDGTGKSSYRHVDSLAWSDEELKFGKIVKLHKFPGDKKLRLFRVANTNRTDWVVTNEFPEEKSGGNNSHRNTAETVGKICAIRWKIEQYHREVKQTLGMEKCQCRKRIAQRNHIGCVAFAWHYLTKMARKAKKTVYALKDKLLSNYMRSQLAKPDLVMPHI